MKKMTHILFLFIGLTFSHISSASVWSWIDNLSTCTSTLQYCYDYDFTVADWDENDPTPNPCYGLNACTIFIGHRHNAAGTSGSRIARSWGAGGSAGDNNWILSAETMGDLGKALKGRFSFPFSTSTRHTGNTVATEECVGFFYRAGSNAGNNDSEVNQSAFEGHPMVPGSICGAAPPPSGSCDFTQDVLTLDHGTLSRKELDGHEVSETVDISCTISQTLKLYIYSAEKVQLRDDGSLYSELFMNDNVLGNTGLTLEVAEQESVVVKSVLRTNGSVAAGEFSGSTVMLITIE